MSLSLAVFPPSRASWSAIFFPSPSPPTSSDTRFTAPSDRIELWRTTVTCHVKATTHTGCKYVGPDIDNVYGPEDKLHIAMHICYNLIQCIRRK